MSDNSKEGLLRQEAPENIKLESEISEQETSEKEAEIEKPQSQEEKGQPQTETTTKRKFLPSKKVIAPVSLPRDEITVKIEKIMEDGLNDSFQRLSPIAKQEFKIKGEQTAYKVRELLKSTHVKVKKIFRLILEWLRILPGINHFFLEQEAKIKTDKIISLKNKI